MENGTDASSVVVIGRVVGEDSRPFSNDDNGTGVSFLSSLRGHRRKLADMTLREEEKEFRLSGFRFCPWLERWRLACTVMHIPHGVSYTQHFRPSASETTTSSSASSDHHHKQGHQEITSVTLPPPENTVLTDKIRIYHTLAQAAQSCQGWMARLSENDLQWHTDTVEELGDTIRIAMSANTKTMFETALAATSGILQALEQHSDLPRFIRKYPHATEGTHFLDAFYAPLFLRIHVMEMFLGTPLVHFAERFPVLEVWVRKFLGWNMFATTLGADFATEIVAYYKDRGSYVFNMNFLPDRNPSATSSLSCEHAKFVPAVALREQRFAACQKILSLKLTPNIPAEVAVPFVAQVLEIEARLLLKTANVDIRLDSLRKVVSLPTPDAVRVSRVVQIIYDGVSGIKRHLLENLSLHQLWQLEKDVVLALNDAHLLPLYVRCLVQTQPMQQLQTYVQAIVEMVLGVPGDELVLKNVLQMVYQECTPSDWQELTLHIPQVQGLVITKENWFMHYKFPAMALLCSFYTLIKAHVLRAHTDMCPPNSSLDSMIPNAADVPKRVETIRFFADMLQQFLDKHYESLLKAVCSQVDIDLWKEQHKSIQGHYDAMSAVSPSASAKKYRMLWKKFKKEVVLYLRNQKKLIVPAVLRFVSGEQLIQAQLACMESLSQAHLQLLMAEINTLALPQERDGVMNVLRFHNTALFERFAPDQDKAVGMSDLKLHPKYAGVPFILGLANRVLMEDMSAVTKASRRALKGLGELPTTDLRNTFEIFYLHFVSHRKIVYEPILGALLSAESDYVNLEPQIEQLEKLLESAEEATESARRTLLQQCLNVAEALERSMVGYFGDLASHTTLQCISRFSYEQSMDLFGAIVKMYHRANPHLLTRTIASLRGQQELEFFCRNILSVPFALLKDVLDSVRAEIPTRIWLQVVQTMPCLSGVALDAQYWSTHPNFAGLPLFWQLSHRWLEHQLAHVLVMTNDRSSSPSGFVKMLNACQRLMMYLEKHGTFEDTFLLPRVACAAPVVAEASFEDTNNEHSLLESNELRVIAILKASFKCMAAQPDVVPSRQVNRMKRQVRSYQTLILPHLTKEEQKYMPVVLSRLTQLQFQVLMYHLFESYGPAMDVEFLIQIMQGGSPAEQKMMLTGFIPFWILMEDFHRAHNQNESDLFFPSWHLYQEHVFTFAEAKSFCMSRRSRLWTMLCKQFPSVFA